MGEVQRGRIVFVFVLQELFKTVGRLGPKLFGAGVNTKTKFDKTVADWCTEHAKSEVAEEEEEEEDEEAEGGEREGEGEEDE